MRYAKNGVNRSHIHLRKQRRDGGAAFPARGHPNRHTQTDPKRTGDMRRRNPALILTKIAPEVVEKGLAAKSGSMPSLFSDAIVSLSDFPGNVNSKEVDF